MADPVPNLKTLMQRVQNGDQSAAQELVEVYGPHIIRVVRERLHERLRPLFDSMDFVQAVWASFFAFAPQQSDLDHPGKLVAFLTQMARHKLTDATRSQLVYEKHNRNREVSLSDLNEETVDCLLAPGPTPAEIAMARDEWDRLLRMQSDLHQRILELLRQGQSPHEVAEQLNLNEKTVRRVIQKVSSGPAHEHH